MSELLIENAVVVGATGGIGAATAAALIEHGAEVHAFSRRGRPSLDLEDEGSIEAAAAVMADKGPLDLVFVATGILHGDDLAPEKSFRQLSAQSFERYFALNATGPALVAKHFLPLLRKDRPAVFAVLSARVGSIGDNRLGGWYGYRTSKAALNMIVKTLAIELKRTHPMAVCIALHPGTVDTGLSQPFQRGVPPEKLFTPQRAAAQLLRVIGSVSATESGAILGWDGGIILP